MASGDEIEDGEILFRYCNPKAFPPDQDEIPVAIFNDPELSCDWERYQKAPYDSFHINQGRTIIIEITISDGIRNPKNPKRNGEVVPEWKQDIIHDPTVENESHSLIKGKKKGSVVDAIRNNSVKYSRK